MQTVSQAGSSAVVDEPTDSARARAHLQKSLQLAPPSLPATAMLAPQPPPYAHQAVFSVDMPPLPPPPVAVAAAARAASPGVVHEALNTARAREALMKTFEPHAQYGAKPSAGAQYGAKPSAGAQYGARSGAHYGAAAVRGTTSAMANGMGAAAAVPVRVSRPPSTHAAAAALPQLSSALPQLSSEAAAIACAGAEAAAQAAAKARAAGAVVGVILDTATPTTAPKAGSGGAPATTPDTAEAPRTRNEGIVQAPASAQLPPSAHASHKISPVPYLNLPDRTPLAPDEMGGEAGGEAGDGAGGVAPNDATAGDDAAAADARDDAAEASMAHEQIVEQIVPAAVSPKASAAAHEPFTVTFKDGWHYEHVRGETFTPSDFTPNDADSPWEGEAPTTTPAEGSGSASMPASMLRRSNRRSHRSSPAEQRAHSAVPVRVAVSYASPPPPESEPSPVGGRFGVQLPAPSVQLPAPSVRLPAPSVRLPAPSAGGAGKGGAAPPLPVPPLHLAALAALAASARAALSSGARNVSELASPKFGSSSRAGPSSASARVLLPLEAVEAVAGTFRETMTPLEVLACKCSLQRPRLPTGTFRETMTPRGETLITRKGVETKATFFEQFSSRLSDGMTATFGRFNSRREPETAPGEGSRGETEVSQPSLTNSLTNSFASNRSEPEWLKSAAEQLRHGHLVQSDRVPPEALESRAAEPLRDGGASVDESLLARSSLAPLEGGAPSSIEICPEICHGGATSSSDCCGTEAESADLGAASMASVSSADSDEASTPHATTFLSPQPPDEASTLHATTFLSPQPPDEASTLHATTFLSPQPPPTVHPSAGSAFPTGSASSTGSAFPTGSASSTGSAFPTGSAAVSGPLASIPLAAANAMANGTVRHHRSLAANKGHNGSLATNKGASLPTVSPCGVARHGIAARRLPPARTAVPSMRIGAPLGAQLGAGVGFRKVGAAGRADSLSAASSAVPADTPERERRAHDAIRAIAAATAAAHPLLLRGEQVERSFEEFDGRDASYYERCA